MHKIKSQLEASARKCMQMALLNFTSSRHQRISEINLQKEYKLKEKKMLDESREMLQSDLAASEINSEQFRSNRKMIILEIDEIDMEIKDIDATLKQLQEEKSVLQCELLMLKNMTS